MPQFGTIEVPVGLVLDEFGDATPVMRVIKDIVTERVRQERRRIEWADHGMKWVSCADPEMDDLEKLAVLAEEFGEVAHELTEARTVGGVDRAALRAELIQVATVAAAWAEALS